MFIMRPTLSKGKWVVKIKEDKTPLSPLIEEVRHSSREAAWNTYRSIKKEEGRGL